MREGPLAEALARDRERYNSLFAYRSRTGRAIDPAAFAAHVCGPLDSAVRAAAPAAGDRIGEVVEALYMVSLDLFSHGCLGPSARTPATELVWETLFPRIGGVLAAAPQRAAAEVFNAVYNIASVDNPAAWRWVEKMAETGSACGSADVFLAAGQVTAWTCGMAHYRESALVKWDGLPDPVKRAVLGLPADDGRSIEEIHRRLRDPWWDPRRPESDPAPGLAVAACAGGFRGFGRLFVTPPVVCVCDGVIFAADSEGCWTLHADVFGATFRRFGPNMPGDGTTDCGPFEFDGGTLKLGADTVAAPEFRQRSSAAGTEHTLAVTLPHSHYVYVAARMT